MLATSVASAQHRLPQQFEPWFPRLFRRFVTQHGLLRPCLAGCALAVALVHPKQGCVTLAAFPF